MKDYDILSENQHALHANGVTRSDFAFSHWGATLRGWLYRPIAAPGPLPVIIMTHGFTALKGHGLAPYAEAFAAADFAVVLYDQRGFGDSEGHMRHEVDPELQCRDLQAAISQISQNALFDAKRIGLWGTSLSGGHVLKVACQDARVKAVVSQVPFISGYANASRLTPEARWPAMLSTFAQERNACARGATPTLRPVVSDDPDARVVLPGPSAYAFFTALPSYPNQVTLSSLALTIDYEPLAQVARLKTPVLMIISDQDTLNHTDLQQNAFTNIPGPKEQLLISGDHFSPYETHFNPTSTAACAWFQTHLA